ncbi:hypothetical protein Lal_00036090 [Lupinus albus]|nr:hypothetical protein Lal_00036090 [Lupinus albus]
MNDMPISLVINGRGQYKCSLAPSLANSILHVVVVKNVHLIFSMLNQRRPTGSELQAPLPWFLSTLPLG